MISNIVWDDDDDFEQLLSQFPAELPPEQPLIDNDSVLISTINIDDANSTRLDATRRSSAFLTNENQSLVHNSTNIELSSQPNMNQTRTSLSSLQRSNTGPLSSPLVVKNPIKIDSPRVRCDSASVKKKKTLCTEAEIEQKRLAALALRRQREQERQKKTLDKRYTHVLLFLLLLLLLLLFFVLYLVSQSERNFILKQEKILFLCTDTLCVCLVK